MPNTDIKPLEYRPNLATTGRIIQRLRSRSCLHFDAWLHCRASDLAFFLIIERRVGGRLRQKDWRKPEYYWIVGDGRIKPVDYAATAGSVPVMINTVNRDYRDALLTIHRDYVLPWAWRKERGFKSYSARLHYWPAPSLPAVPAGTMNYCTRGGKRAGPVLYAQDREIGLAIGNSVPAGRGLHAVDVLLTPR